MNEANEANPMTETDAILESIARRLHAITKRLAQHEITMNTLASAIRDLQETVNSGGLWP